MKQYKEVENKIEYEVFEFDETEQDYEVRIIERFEYAKIKRVYDTYTNTYYFKRGEAHNDYGPAMVAEATGPVYYRFGDKVQDEEWKAYYRTMIMDRMLNSDEFPPKPKKLEDV